MPAFVDELSEVRTSTTSSLPFQVGNCRSSFKCSYNFDQYLLSSSPPGFGYELWQKNGQLVPHLSEYQYGSRHQIFDSLYEDCSIRKKKKEQPCILIQNANSSSSAVDTTSPSNSESEISTRAETENSRRGRVKKVSFADDFGFQLTKIKYFFEMPDMPSVIKTKAMMESVKILPLGQNLASSSPTKATKDNPTLVPDFSMPISNPVAFSEKVDRDCVSLESLYAEPNHTLTGTVRVKNLGFHKSVFVRYSFDAWKTSFDVTCSYRPAFYSEAGHSYDSFSFVLNVPPDFSARSAEFAVCFQCNGKEYWDNNFGSNYHLISTCRFVQDPKDDQKLSEKEWMSHMDWMNCSVSWPYW